MLSREKHACASLLEKHHCASHGNTIVLQFLGKHRNITVVDTKAHLYFTFCGSTFALSREKHNCASRRSTNVLSCGNTTMLHAPDRQKQNNPKIRENCRRKKTRKARETTPSQKREKKHPDGRALSERHVTCHIAPWLLPATKHDLNHACKKAKERPNNQTRP